MYNRIIIKTRSKFHTFQLAQAIAHSAYMEDWNYRLTKSDFSITVETDNRDMDLWLMEEYSELV